jgi:hypothetical protein
LDAHPHQKLLCNEPGVTLRRQKAPLIWAYLADRNADRNQRMDRQVKSVIC